MSNFWKTLDRPITVLAPMDDVTDFVFREVIATTAKPDVLFTEFTSIDGLFSKGHEKTAQKLRYSAVQKPLVAQIWGNDPKRFANAAKLIKELGIDGIDINMGCPDRSVMKKQSGAAMINNKVLAEEIINAIKSTAPDIPLSIKTRLDKEPALTEEWLRFLLSQNIQALILHGRTAKVKSKGNANWDEISKAVKLRNEINADVIVIGNGDVKSYKEILDKKEEYGVDGVMVGRGIFQNPWLFEKNETSVEHSQREYISLLRKHLDLYDKTWGETKSFQQIRKFFKIYVKGFAGADAMRIKLMECKDYASAITVLNEI